MVSFVLKSEAEDNDSPAIAVDPLDIFIAKMTKRALHTTVTVNFTVNFSDDIKPISNRPLRFDVFLSSRGLLLRGKPGKVKIFMTQARSSAQWTSSHNGHHHRHFVSTDFRFWKPKTQVFLGSRFRIWSL